MDDRAAGLGTGMVDWAARAGLATHVEEVSGFDHRVIFSDAHGPVLQVSKPKHMMGHLPVGRFVAGLDYAEPWFTPPPRKFVERLLTVLLGNRIREREGIGEPLGPGAAPSDLFPVNPDSDAVGRRPWPAVLAPTGRTMIAANTPDATALLPMVSRAFAMPVEQIRAAVLEADGGPLGNGTALNSADMAPDRSPAALREIVRRIRIDPMVDTGTSDGGPWDDGFVYFAHRVEGVRSSSGFRYISGRALPDGPTSMLGVDELIDDAWGTATAPDAPLPQAVALVVRPDGAARLHTFAGPAAAFWKMTPANAGQIAQRGREYIDALT